MKFWKNNRLDQEHEKSFEDVLKGFKESKQYNSFEQGYNLDRALRGFLTENYGTFEEDEYQKLFSFIHGELI